MKTRLMILGLFVITLLVVPLFILPAQAQGPGDLTIDKTVTLTNDPAQPGDLITYTVLITNSAPVSATGVIITDTLPSGVNGTPLSITTAISPNTTYSTTLTATVSSAISPGITITNTAYYSAAVFTASGQASVAFTTAMTTTPPATATLDILEPTTLNPAYAGSFTNTQKIIIRVTKPELGLTTNQFTVTIGGTVATIVTLYEGTDEYVLEVDAPTQAANGLYDLDIAVTTSTGLENDSEPQSVYYSNANNVDVMLVVDRSGSMQAENNITKAKDAAKQFVDLLVDDDQVGVVSFSDNVTVDFNLTTIVSGTRTAAKNAIDPLTANGFTTIGGGLEAAQNELTTTGIITHPWAIVLLSDGLENRPPFVADVLPDIKATKTVVHSIGLGSLADRVLLQDIAAETNGTFNFAPSGAELGGIYNTIAGLLTGQQTLISFDGVVASGATDEKDVVIDSTLDQAIFSISWSGSGATLDLTLEDPAGTLIDPAVAASNADVDFVSGSSYQYYKVVSPTLVAGTWKMKISNGTFAITTGSGVSAAAGETPYTGQLLGDTNLNLRAYASQNKIDPGNDIKISVTLSDDQPITGATVAAYVGPLFPINPSAAAQEDIPSLYKDLFDDGQHGDGLANDGVYANTFPGSQTVKEGVYNFTTFAKGTANTGQSFERESRTSVLVGQDAPASFLGDFSVYLPLITK